MEKDSTIRKNLIVQNEGGRQVSRNVFFYNLDVIISVGYRVKSNEGTRFRIWATKVLREHIVNGHNLNKDRLSDLENMYHCLSDTMFQTTMLLNKHIIDSARQKDLVILMEDIEKVKEDIENIKKKPK